MDDETLTSHPEFENSSALVAGSRTATWLSRDGEIETISHRETHARLRDGAMPLVCHRRLTATAVRAGAFQAYDILELFAFVRPAVFCLPTPGGVAQALGLALPEGPEQTAAMLFTAADKLLGDLAKLTPDTKDIAWNMARAGWSWGPQVLTRFGGGDAPHSSALRGAMQVWRRLPDWEDRPREMPPGSLPVSVPETRTRLGMLLGAPAAFATSRTGFHDRLPLQHHQADRDPRGRAQHPRRRSLRFLDHGA